ncbi:putative inner membrane protein [Chlamydia ibidis]|uniref:Inner membrane protein n=2 Tax=Chlamydia ibidis TaxID=1405396 RepID=A0ABN0N072_9CHLA|nr:DUF5422 family protein [Chlamydia ibidis]EPP34368.1 putative inner membrane protein [Chlamydia ibidis]EQM63014.1 putative inner membrane protein [Chlamydia ibidis 10-1398/6]
MECLEVVQKGSNIYLDCIFPERGAARQCKSLAQSYPRIAMTIEILASVVLGTFKMVTLPVATFASLFLLPIAGIRKAICTKQASDTLPYVFAWLISLLSVAAIVGLVFAMIALAPEAAFLMIGVFGAIGASSTLINLHNEMFPVRVQPTIPFDEGNSRMENHIVSPKNQESETPKVSNLGTNTTPAASSEDEAAFVDAPAEEEKTVATAGHVSNTGNESS